MVIIVSIIEEMTGIALGFARDGLLVFNCVLPQYLCLTHVYSIMAVKFAFCNVIILIFRRFLINTKDISILSP